MHDVVRETFMVGRVHYGIIAGIVYGSEHRYFKMDCRTGNFDWVQITHSEYSKAEPYGLYPSDGSIRYNIVVEKQKHWVDK